ncbi:hypothetical protein QBC35DRAFT_386412 [Podospora australis]|uniref:Beta/gamma crystallin 'Greek key' domain-containing protein n=1 Tax=Podospora australis TaxID=1536484 RepID=A0AAN7AFK9_9PEZI|nr:hypothetical protein QBC35DRAFT_386412 [Podospora australis]
MFNLKNIAILLALGVLSASAAPASDVSVAVAEAEQPAIVAKSAQEIPVYACQGSRWRGACRKLYVDVDECFNVHPDFNDNISSIKNEDTGRSRCMWFEDANCRGRYYKNQEDANLADGDGYFNDRISSISCYAWRGD